ncbi:MAG: protein translocase subunit SecF [Chloroflexi bacterium]|nr:protein translocase subunit SecF [Chloroflexota bacterium]
MIISTVQTGGPLKPAIDFTGGTLWELTNFQQPLELAPVREIMAKHGFGDAALQTSEKAGQQGLMIRAKHIGSEDKAAIDADLKERFGGYTELRFESVGPAIGAEVAQRAQWAVALAALGVLLYISWAFRQVPNPLRYGACAIISLLHDVLLVVGLFSLFGLVFGIEVDALFLTAILTGPIGFSVHDTIVVFDRIRENRKRYPNEQFERLVNHSVLQTLDRSLNTTLTTLFTLTALFLFGGVTIRNFVLALLIGITTGTYSSIFNASCLLVVWENGEIGRFFRRLSGRGGQPAVARGG